MSSHANASNNTSQGGGGGGYPSTWPFNAAGFNAAAAVGTNAAHTSPTTSNSSSSGGIGRPLLSSGSGSMFPTSGGSGGSGRYAARTGNPYETSLVRRRNQIDSAAASSRDRRTQNGQSQGGDPERKRVVVACLRCRKRKIRCSGDDGNGGSCTNCKNANEPQCLFMRVQAGSLAEMRKKEHEKRMATAAAVNTFSYDLDACRQYQSRGVASIGPNMSVSAPPAHSTVYGASSTSAFGGPSSVMYNWAPGAAGGGYGDGSGHGAGAHGNGGASMGYGMPYNSMSYHGMPSPEASYLGENDLMDRPTTATMADAGAFALQSLSQGLTSGSSHGHPYGQAQGHGHGAMATSTPRSLPGPPTVLGSSRGVPPSSVFSASRAPQQYPSPATTPITSGVSPVWTGYEQSPYGTAAMPTSMAAQSLERLPDLYTATPPPPAENTASGRPGGGSQDGDDEGVNGGDGSSNGNGHSQAQQQHSHFEYNYGDSGGQSEGNGEEHSGGSGVDMVNSHTAAPGTY